MERTMLAWNIPNWITVMLMAAAGYFAIGLISQLFQQGGTSQPGNVLRGVFGR